MQKSLLEQDQNEQGQKWQGEEMSISYISFNAVSILTKIADRLRYTNSLVFWVRRRDVSLATALRIFGCLYV
jgi:hypothetical protein